MLSEPAIWTATPLESAWHQSITDISRHTAKCNRCGCAEAYGRRDYCRIGLALREAEQAAHRATKADMYVPLALADMPEGRGDDA